MNKQWHKGPPPSIGWWPASYSRESDFYRWWNGDCWSMPAFRESSISQVAEAAECKEWLPQRIEWKQRPKSWPERSKI